jgi:broad specificity phosphatase PhoE
MKLVIVRHGDTEWTVSRRYTGSTDLPLTRHGDAQAAALAPLLERLLSAQTVLVFSSPLRRATTTAALAMPGWLVTVNPLVAEYDYGDYEGLTEEQIDQLAPGWDIWRDGCPHGDSTSAVGARADRFLAAHVLDASETVVVVSHGHFSRILAARALGLPAENGRLFASVTASISVIEDYHGQRCIGKWNLDAALLDAALLDDGASRNASHDRMSVTEPHSEEQRCPSTRRNSG